MTRLRLAGGTAVENPEPPPPPSEIERVLRDTAAKEKELIAVVVVLVFANGEMDVDSTFPSHSDDASVLMRGAQYSSECAQEAIAENAGQERD
jgi:hypothetical protein